MEVLCNKFTKHKLSLVSMVGSLMAFLFGLLHLMSMPNLTVGTLTLRLVEGFSMSFAECVRCSGQVHPDRSSLGYDTCLVCGEVMARKRVFTVAPMHKSNYMLFTNPEDLKGINNKGGNVR
jgi:hypothetical protein